uniref:Uncharacterized protein n=1 Tax=Chenopodium quinoa TaxID=63459 RepID=A0A803L0G9_CHEQI
MSSGFDQSFLRNEDDLKHLTSLEILKCATKILKSNTMFMVLTIMSVLPLFVFMVLYEIKISEKETLSCRSIALPVLSGERSSSLTVKEITKEGIYKNVILKVLSHHFIMQYLFLREDFVKILSIGFHALIFYGILYKYLEWIVLWNMAMVISMLQIEASLYALELSAYYGKHFAVTVIGFGLVFFGSLVKWVALVAYFYDCKAQVSSKKAQEEVHKAVEADDLC